MEDSTSNSRRRWLIGIFVTLLCGFLVPIIVALISRTPSSASNEHPPTSSDTPAPSVIADSTTVASPSVTATALNPSGRPTAQPVQGIVAFRIVPSKDNQTGPNTFRASYQGKLTFRFQYEVLSASGDIGSCTITRRVVRADTSEPVDTTSGAYCTPGGYVDGAYLAAGAYRIEAEVYVPDINTSQSTSYDFTITP